MKLFKKLLPVWALLLPVGLFAQDVEIDLSRNVIVQGKAGKMIVFRSMPNVSEVYLSRNGKFLFGRSEDNDFGVIYEIATEKIQTFNGSVVEVIDWDNYVTTTFAKLEGKEYIDIMKNIPANLKPVIEEASADLLTLRASTYITRPGADFGNVLIDTKTGTILDTLKELDPNVPDGGKMNMGLAMSDDAKIVVGRATKIGAPVNYSPAFWDRDRDAVYFTGYEYVNNEGKNLYTAGQMFDVNGSGTIMCGDIREKACYLRYNRTTGTISEPTYIPSKPGFEVAYAFRINESGVIIGTEQSEAVEIGGRIPYIYFTENDTKYDMAEYLQELYGLDAEQDVTLFTPTGISDDNRLISGYSSDDATWYAWLIILDEHQIYAPVRNVQVKNTPLRTLNVEVSWQAPLEGEYTLTGYNVFRNNEKLNSQPLPISQLSFKDTTPESGKYKYYVKAVYGDSISEAPDTISIFVVDPTGCLPVQEVFNKVEYNRTVSLYWGLPSEKESSNIINRPKSSAPKYLPQDELDFVSLFQPVVTRMSAGIRIGDYIYAGSYTSGSINVFDLSGNIVKEIQVDGLANIYDMTYHNGSFYVATARDRVDVLDLNPNDPFDIDYANHFSTSFKSRGVISITYVENSDPAINNGEDYLLLGDYWNLACYPLSATGPESEFKLPVSLGVGGMIISGVEYYNGRLYIASQSGVDGCDVTAYDMATGNKLFTTNLYSHPTVIDASNGANLAQPVFSGGLTHSTLPDGTVVLECLVQCQSSYNMLVDMELESSSDVLGYVVYRNDEKISDTLHARHFTEVIDDPGKYVYHIEYLSTRGCRSSSKAMEATTEVNIFEKGACASPAKFEVFESNKSAVLTWSDELILGADGLVGFNLYRNGRQIGEKNFVANRYIDSLVNLDTKYTYTLESFYANSCTAFDTVSITLNNKGAAREPSAFKVEGTRKADNTVDAKATWGLPYFEEPMAYGYCGVPVGGNSLEGVSQLFCVIGWDYTNMDQFDDDLYLVGVEFVLASAYGVPGALLKSLGTVVYVNDNLVYNEPYDGRVQPREWARAYFSQVFKMKQDVEIAVGYTVSYNPDEMAANNQSVFAIDMGPRVPGKSNLISYDGREFASLYAIGGLDVNLCINALVVRLRDLEAAAMAADPKEYMMSKVVRMDLDARLGKTVQFADAPKTSSEGIKLKGFNIYRDGEKLNENLMTGFSYEENVPLIDDDYEYEVGAVYEGADEIKSEPIFINFKRVDVEELQQAYQVSVYPNPASDVLNVKGEYVSFSLVDINGRVMMRDVRNTESVSLAGLNEGVYFVLITLPNGDKRSVKIIKR